MANPARQQLPFLHHRMPTKKRVTSQHIPYRIMAERCVNKLYLNKERIRIKVTDGSVETLIRLVKLRNVTKYYKEIII
jgi:hypothetical protein